MVAALRAFLALFFGGAAAYFVRYRYRGREQSIWFLLWLLAATAHNAYGAVSYWVEDAAISETFWIASYVALTLGVFLIYAFTRSFSVEASHTLFFWSLPLLADLSILIVNHSYLFRRSNGNWVPAGYNALFIVHILLNVFYAVLALYYAAVLYTDLRKQSHRPELNRFLFIFAGIAVVFLSVSVGGGVRIAMNPGSPVSEIGMLIGGLIMLRGMAGRKTVPGKAEARGG